jgi:hypothetical protein
MGKIKDAVLGPRRDTRAVQDYKQLTKADRRGEDLTAAEIARLGTLQRRLGNAVTEQLDREVG